MSELNCRILFFTLFVYFGTFNIRAEENCDKLGTLLYEDLGCTPEIPEGNTCPTSYKCGSFARSNASCIFKGKMYNLTDKVDDDLTYPGCKVGCYCEIPYQENLAAFSCAILDCPEWLGAGPAQLKFQCYRTYRVDGCCSTGQQCPPLDGVAKCTVDGKEYMEGERFYKPNACLDCVCLKGWEGKFEGPFCKRRTCVEQITNSEKIAEHCAPVYLGGDVLCCPDGWLCHSQSHVVTRTRTAGTNSTLTCQYGKLKLQIGEGFDAKFDYYSHTKDVSCECVVPPFLTCKGKN